MESLIGYGLSNNNWESIRQYMIHRGKVQNCTGVGNPVELSTSTGRYRWYSPRYNEIEGFVCCEGCYEDLVSATNFRDRFILSNDVVNHNNQASCDMCVPFIKRCLLEHAQSQNWRAFTEWATARLRIPACKDLSNAPCSSTLWYMPHPPMHNVMICGACFHDRADLTPLSSSFSQVQIPPNRGNEVWQCANGTLAMTVIWNEACEKKNISIWQNAVRTIPNLPICAKEGIQNVTWHTINNNPHFAICARCYIGLIQTFGMGGYFHQINGPADGSAHVCDFHPSIARAHSYYNKLDEALALQDFSIFTNFVARISPLPVCPKDVPHVNRSWYCGEEATICASCYEEAFRDTKLAHLLTSRIRPDKCICDGYSPRMRGLWNKACTENNIQPFNAALRERIQVYQATVPRMREILEIAKMRMKTQQTLMMSSIMLSGANNIVAASSAYNPYQYGNAQLGWYETSAGAQGAAQFQQAVNMNVARTGDMAEMKQLGAIWRQYE